MPTPSRTSAGVARPFAAIARVLLGLAALLSTAAPAHAAAACANASIQPQANDAPQMSAAIVCLINATRMQDGLAPLHPSAVLNGTAMRHSRSMVAHDYFGHDTPSGSTPAQRMHAAGACALTCALGENIAWASGSYATPAAIVSAWMASPGHRANILDGSFRWEGIGVATGSPAMMGARGLAGATVTQDFAS